MSIYDLHDIGTGSAMLPGLPEPRKSGSAEITSFQQYYYTTYFGGVGNTRVLPFTKKVDMSKSVVILRSCGSPNPNGDCLAGLVAWSDESVSVGVSNAPYSGDSVDVTVLEFANCKQVVKVLVTLAAGTPGTLDVANKQVPLPDGLNLRKCLFFSSLNSINVNDNWGSGRAIFQMLYDQNQLHLSRTFIGTTYQAASFLVQVVEFN